MKIGAKIFTGFLGVILLMAVSGGISIYLLKDVRNSSEALQNNSLPLVLKTNQLAANAGLKVAAIRGFLLTGDDNFINDFQKLDTEDDAIIQELIDKAVTEQGKRLAQEEKQLDDTYQKIAFEEAIPLKRAGKTDEAIAVMKNKLAPAAAATRAKIQEYVQFRTSRINKTLDSDQDKIDRAQWITASFLVIALVCGATIAYLITRSVNLPLKSSVNYLNMMARGDFSQHINSKFLESKDETGDMARAMQKMIENMQETIRKLASSSEQLAASSEELASSAEQSSQATNQIASSIMDVSAGANEQLAAANETSAVVEQMSASIQQVAANTNQVAAQSGQAADKAKDGGKALERAVSQMGQIENTVNSSAKVVEILGERSKEIGQIVDTISGIAGQTNLLALNAAIEAARAGEQGRGFAVVAEEVRKLAEQSQEATEKIAKLIEEIQGDTDKAVIAMNDGTREVKTGTEVVSEARTAFNEIMDLITQVSGQVKEISAAIQQMATGSEQIVGSVKKIDNLSKKSAGESQSISAATEEQLASIEEISSSSEELAKLAQDLQLAVSKFRV